MFGVALESSKRICRRRTSERMEKMMGVINVYQTQIERCVKTHTRTVKSKVMGPESV